jgi:hypothetical protein
MIEQINRVKLLLLNTKQKLAFEYLKKPNLGDKEELCLFEIDLNRNKAKEALQIINYYIRKARDNSLNQNDIEMLPLLDPVLRKCIYEDQTKQKKCSDLVYNFSTLNNYSH